MSDISKTPIGGYFEFELQNKSKHYHNALHLNSGRSCLAHALLRAKAKKIYIPYYICNSVLEPFLYHGIDYEYYRIDSNFEIAEAVHLRDGEKILYVNYYGLKEKYIKYLIGKYGYSLIIDNTQGFFMKSAENIDTFYSARKFFGVPDGAYLYPSDGMAKPEIIRNPSSLDKCAHLIGRMADGPREHYKEYLINEESFKYDGVKGMSVLSERILTSIDYDCVMARRQKNYMHIHDALRDYNNLHIDDSKLAGPMCYPLLVCNDNLRELLIEEQVFVPQYWKEVLECDLDADSPEFKFAKYLLPLPIDQRYSLTDMDRIIEVIKCAI